MTAETKEQIDQSDTFVCVVPPGGVEGLEGETHLLYALMQEKVVVVWRREPLEERPFPVALKGKNYLNVYEVCGPQEALTDKLMELSGNPKVLELDIKVGAYDLPTEN